MVAVFRNNFAEAQRWLDRAAERKLTLPDFLMIRYLIAFLQGNEAEMDRVGIAFRGV
jgi:predicted Zn-dependent protease